MTSPDTPQSQYCHHPPSHFSEASSSFLILSKISRCLVSTTGVAGGGSSGGGTFEPFPDALLPLSFLAGTGVYKHSTQELGVAATVCIWHTVLVGIQLDWREFSVPTAKVLCAYICGDRHAQLSWASQANGGLNRQ